MLRVTQAARTDSEVTLMVEGRVVLEWAVVLEGECARLLGQGYTVRLDLSEVGWVDAAGVETLHRLCARDVRIVRCKPLIAELLWAAA